MSSDIEQVIVVIGAPELGASRPVGTLTRLPGHKTTVEFLYARSWLESGDGFALQPSLPLIEAPTYTTGYLPGVFADTAPDMWGRQLMDHRAGRELDDWEYLLRVDDHTRMGALRYQRAMGDPFLSEGDPHVPPLTQLRALQEMARRIEVDPDAILDDEVARTLLAPGSSLGGIRPKANYTTPDGSLWIAKFPSRRDRRDVGAWEHVYARLAHRAGITVPETGLLEIGEEGHTFTTRRFDRVTDARRLYASARTLSGNLDRDADYADIAHAIATSVAPDLVSSDLAQMYRRMTFNVLAGNRDDHLRNHGFLRAAEGWRLAPAFDLNPSRMVAHATAIDGRSAAVTTEHLLDARPYFDLADRPARAIITDVSEAVATWRELAREAGITLSEQKLVARSLAPLPAFS